MKRRIVASREKPKKEDSWNDITELEQACEQSGKAKDIEDRVFCYKVMMYDVCEI